MYTDNYLFINGLCNFVRIFLSQKSTVLCDAMLNLGMVARAMKPRWGIGNITELVDVVWELIGLQSSSKSPSYIAYNVTQRKEGEDLIGHE